MSASDNSTQKINRKLKYKELIEKGTKISEYSDENCTKNKLLIFFAISGECLENNNPLDNFDKIIELINGCETIANDFAREGKVEDTADYLMDATIIKMSHDLVGSVAEKTSDNSFCEDQYINVLLELVDSYENDAILEISTACCATASFQLAMLGTFSFETELTQPNTQKNKREKFSKKPKGEKKAPESITQIIKSEKGAEKINTLTMEIERIIKERGTEVPYYELITDPNSFMNTVDVAFKIAFLLRDGIVGLKRINKRPYVYMTNKKDRGKRTGEEAQNTVQTIMAIDPPKWRKYIRKYKLEAPILRLQQETDEDTDDSD